MPDAQHSEHSTAADAEPTDAGDPQIEIVRKAEEPCAEQPLAARIEALLMGSDRPLSEGRLGAILGVQGKGSTKAIREAIAALNDDYEKQGRSFRAENVAGGWQILTRSEFGPLLLRLHTDRMQSRLSQAALETLAIVAYRQPIMRAEIEAIRGVACGEVLRGLLERRLVKIVGRAEELGRPMLYGTTREFLKVFGLSDSDDLPEVKGLKPAPAYTPSKSDDAETSDAVPAESPEATEDPADPA